MQSGCGQAQCQAQVHHAGFQVQVEGAARMVDRETIHGGKRYAVAALDGINHLHLHPRLAVADGQCHAGPIGGQAGI